MSKISIILTGPRYKEYHIDYAVSILRSIFPSSEIILSTNDSYFERYQKKDTIFDKIIWNDDSGELPSLKFEPESKPSNDRILNNNINKQITCCINGITAASYDLVLRLRTDQILLTNDILNLWNIIKDIPTKTNKKGRIITSSIFSINPRYSERMPYHISDMLQFGYKIDLIDYFSAPEFPFEYAIWYERNPHAPESNKFERAFRARYAVEQWLALHYIFKSEDNFPIQFHNQFDPLIIEKFESTFIDYFFIAHPDDITLRASKFTMSASYYNTQCYSTRECLSLLTKKYPVLKEYLHHYPKKGINKTYFKIMMPVIYCKPIQSLIKLLPPKTKDSIKKILENLAK